MKHARSSFVNAPGATTVELVCNAEKLSSEIRRLAGQGPLSKGTADRHFTYLMGGSSALSIVTLLRKDQALLLKPCPTNAGQESYLPSAG